MPTCCWSVLPSRKLRTMYTPGSRHACDQHEAKAGSAIQRMTQHAKVCASPIVYAIVMCADSTTTARLQFIIKWRQFQDRP